MGAEIDAAKATARKAAFAARRAAHAAGLDGAAQDHLRATLAAHGATPIAGYMPIRTEIDPLPVMAAHAGPVGVPVIRGPGQALEFHRWHPGCAMIEGPFGARIPAAGEIVCPRVVIVPLVAFDAQGYRLGYGGGFYDRTLAGLRALGPVLAIGFGYSAQQIDSVPVDAFDQRLDAMVTETGIERFTAAR